ncbi:MAG: SRPBCC family protein [Pseudomonadota bacterium]
MSEIGQTGATTFTTPTDKEIVMTHVVEAPQQLVFDTWTRPEHIPHWMLGPEGWSMPVCEIDFRPGGPWRMAWKHADGSEMEMTGVYKEIEPPSRVVNTESWGGDWAETLNTLEITEDNGKTTMVSRMLYPSKEARDRALETDMQAGVNVTFERLDAYLKTLA